MENSYHSFLVYFPTIFDYCFTNLYGTLALYICKINFAVIVLSRAICIDSTATEKLLSKLPHICFLVLVFCVCVSQCPYRCAAFPSNRLCFIKLSIKFLEFKTQPVPFYSLCANSIS